MREGLNSVQASLQKTQRRDKRHRESRVKTETKMERMWPEAEGA